MTHKVDGASTAASALVAPLIRLRQTNADDRAASVVAGILGFVWDPVFWVGIGLLMALNAWDYILGYRVADLEDRWSGTVAFNGALSKLTALVLLVALRVLEAWLPEAGVTGDVATHGFLATTATAGLIISEFHSILRNDRRLGGRALAPIHRAIAALGGGRAQG